MEHERRRRLRIIWQLAWPVIVTLALESLVGLVDTLMVGRLGATAVAAVGVGTQVLGALNVVMMAVGTGTLAIVARAVGAGEIRDAEDSILQSVLLGGVLAVLVALPVAACAPAIIPLFGVSPEVAALGVPFLRVVVLAVPAGTILFVVGSALRASGDTRTPLLIGIVVNFINVVANYVLIFGAFGFPALGVIGSGSATALAFSTGAVLGLVLLSSGRLRLRLLWTRWRPQPALLRRILAVGLPTAAEQLFMQIGFFLYVIFAARYGTSAVAAYFIGVKILALSFHPGNGFGAAAATLVGQYLGARAPALARRSGWDATGLALIMMSTGGFVLFLGAEPIARAFVADPEVVSHTVGFIHVLAAAQPLMAIDFTLGGSLRGAGDTRFPLLTVLIGFYVCRLGFAATATYVLGAPVFWVWFALLGDYVARALLKSWRFQSGAWQV